jgi:hypothetical protein
LARLAARTLAARSSLPIDHVLEHDSRAYAFIFDQKGLMAGIGLTGQKITKIEP